MIRDLGLHMTLVWSKNILAIYQNVYMKTKQENAVLMAFL